MYRLLIVFTSFLSAKGIINEPIRVDLRNKQESDYFLPGKIEATKYDIYIKPYFLDEFQDPYFQGSSVITFYSKEHGTTEIYLNVGKGLNIGYRSVKIVSSDGSPINPTFYTYDNVAQILKIELDRELVPLIYYSIQMTYTGIITVAGYGLFRGSYVEPDNRKRFYLGTQLRPVYARQLFPCLDEPRYKATFILSVDHPSDFNVLSNMPPVNVSQVDNNGIQRTTFAETPVMSAYLLTLFVFQFSSVGSRSPSIYIQPRFTGWSTPSKIRQMDWSQQICPILVNIAEEYLKSPLPVPKIDQIALPELVVIAMENWGINTYREPNILADQTSPYRQLQTAARFTGHEVLHHWIGNLVTLEWWDYLWIQEAFAMYFEYYFPNQMAPDWRMMDQFITDLTVEGLHGDNKVSPLTSRVVTPEEITNKFMGLTYTKGPALIRMIEHTVGTDNFRNALVDLIQRKKYSTMTPKDLWDSFQNFTLIQNINSMMSTWTDKGSYPILYVTREISTNSLFIEQSSSDAEINEITNSSLLWHIPISFTTSQELNFEDTSPAYLMKERNLIHQLGPLTNIDWIILNLQFTGYYRILYDNTLLTSLINQLNQNHHIIHHLNRAQLIDDIFYFADKNIVPYWIAFNLIDYLKNEREYVPLRVALRAFNGLDARLLLTPDYGKFQDYIKILLNSIYKDVGFFQKFNDRSLDLLNREQIVQWACYFNVDDCRVTAFNLLDTTARNGLPMTSLPADTRSTVMCYGIKYGSYHAQLYFLNELYKKINVKNTDILDALACSPQETLLTILNEKIPNNTWTDMFTSIIKREENSLLAVNYLTKNLDKIMQRVGEDVAVNFIQQLSAKLSLQGITEEITKNLISNTSGSSPKIATALSTLFQNILVRDEWLKQRYADIRTTLDVNLNKLQMKQPKSLQYFYNNPFLF